MLVDSDLFHVHRKKFALQFELVERYSKPL